MTFVNIITDQEYIDLVKLWKSNDPVDSNEMVDMIEYCIEKHSIQEEVRQSFIGIAKESGEPGDVIEVKLPKRE